MGAATSTCRRRSQPGSKPLTPVVVEWPSVPATLAAAAEVEAASTFASVASTTYLAPLKASDGDRFKAWCADVIATTAKPTALMSSEELLKLPKCFSGLWSYRFTGKLRPAHVTPKMPPPTGVDAPDYATDPHGICYVEQAPGAQSEIPIVKGQELKTLRAACRLGREVLDVASAFLRAGVTGDEIDRIVYQACVDRGIYPSPLNYFLFPKSLCVSPNEVICHGIPDCRPIEDGDIVNLDITIYYKGFHSDLNETFFIGTVDDDSHRTVKAAYNALRAATKVIRPGAMYRDLGNVIQAETERHGCAVVPSYCGHGIGRLFHGCPRIPHYRKNKAVGVMKPGHVFCVEPMVNDGPDGSDALWPDNWTAVTRNGLRSAAFEHTLIVTDTGVEVLTARIGAERSKMPEYDASLFQR